MFNCFTYPILQEIHGQLRSQTHHRVPVITETQSELESDSSSQHMRDLQIGAGDGGLSEDSSLPKDSFIPDEWSEGPRGMGDGELEAVRKLALSASKYWEVQLMNIEKEFARRRERTSSQSGKERISSQSPEERILQTRNDFDSS